MGKIIVTTERNDKTNSLKHINLISLQKKVIIFFFLLTNSKTRQSDLQTTSIQINYTLSFLKPDFDTKTRTQNYKAQG